MWRFSYKFIIDLGCKLPEDITFARNMGSPWSIGQCWPAFFQIQEFKNINLILNFTSHLEKRFGLYRATRLRRWVKKDEEAEILSLSAAMDEGEIG